MINQGQEYQYFKDKISHLEREVSRLSPYEYEHRLLKDVIADCLLQGQITAWRFVEATGDCQAGITILKILQDDLNYFFAIGKLSQKQYSQWLEKWLSFLERGRIAFKGEKDFERYFQDQKEANRSLFSDFNL